MFYLSAQSSLPKILPPFYLSDKLLHGLEYAIFGMLVVRALERSPRGPRMAKTCITLAVIIVILYGISDEVHQSFIPQRDASVYDALADAIGGALGIILAHRLIKKEILP